jgi:hypothetical protein
MHCLWEFGGDGDALLDNKMEGACLISETKGFWIGMLVLSNDGLRKDVSLTFLLQLGLLMPCDDLAEVLVSFFMCC